MTDKTTASLAASLQYGAAHLPPPARSVLSIAHSHGLTNVPGPGSPQRTTGLPPGLQGRTFVATATAPSERVATYQAAANALFPLSRPGASEGPDFPLPSPMPPHHIPQPHETGAVLTTLTDAHGNDVKLIDQYLSLVTGVPSSVGDTSDSVTALLRGAPNLEALGLDRRSLEDQGVAAHHVSRLHAVLHANAAAFATWMSAEQKRLALLVAQRDNIPVADRLLAFITGAQASPLDDVDPLPSLISLQHAHAARQSDVEARVVGPVPQGVDASSQATPAGTQTVHEDDERDARMDLSILRPEDVMKEQEVIAAAAAGNVVGLRRLLGRYRAVHLAVHQRLEGRLAHETARAQRLQDKLDDATAALDANAHEMEQQLSALASAQQQLDTMDKALAAEQEVVAAERAVSMSLREEITLLEAQWAAQQAEAVARVTEQLEIMAAQAEGQLDLREQYLERIKELVMLQLRHDHEVRRAARLEAELAAARAAHDAVQVEADGLQAWRARLEAQASAAEGLASASAASVVGLARDLAKERTAHRRTRELLHQVQHRVEAARTAATDVHARASATIRSQAVELRENEVQITRLERQLEEARDIVRIKSFETDSARAAKKAAVEQLEREHDAFLSQQAKVIALELQLAGLREQLADAQRRRDDAIAAGSANERALKELREELLMLRRHLADVREWAEAREAHEQELAKTQEALAHVRAELDAALAQLEQQGLELARLRAVEADHTALKPEHARVLGELGESRSECARVGGERDEARASLAARTDELEGAVAALKTAQAELERARAVADKAQAEASARAQAILGLQHQVRSLEEAVEGEQAKVASLTGEVNKLNKLHDVIKGLRSEVRDLSDKLRSAEAGRVAALADRQWYLEARQQLEQGMQEYIATGQREAEALRELAADVTLGLATLQGSMLGLGDDTPVVPHEPSPLAAQDAAVARDVSAALTQVVARVGALVATEARVREEVTARVATLEAGQTASISSATEFWRDALAAGRARPAHLRAVLYGASERAVRAADTMAGVANTRSSADGGGFGTEAALDPASPLAQLTPVSLVEAQAAELSGMRRTVGELRAALESAAGRTRAAEEVVALERSAADTRHSHMVSLVQELRRQIADLNADVAAARGGRQLAEHVAAHTSRRAQEAEYAVAKARQREVMGGLSGLVPSRHVDRGVQTVYSELWVHEPPATPAEAGRRATGVSGVPSWGTDIGSGAVALPPLLLAPETSGAAATAGRLAHGAPRPWLGLASAAAAAVVQEGLATAAVMAGASGARPTTAPASMGRATSGSGTWAGSGTESLAAAYSAAPLLGPYYASLSAASGGLVKLRPATARTHSVAAPGGLSRPVSAVSTISTPSRGGSTAGSRPTTALSMSDPASPAHPLAPSVAHQPTLLPEEEGAHSAGTAAAATSSDTWVRPVSALPGMPTITDEDEGEDVGVGWAEEETSGEVGVDGVVEDAEGEGSAPDSPAAGSTHSQRPGSVPLYADAEHMPEDEEGGWAGEAAHSGYIHYSQEGGAAAQSAAGSQAELSAWDWAVEAAGLAAGLKPLSLQDTLDVIADVYRAKSEVDRQAAAARAPEPPMPEFLGQYMDAVYCQLYGPRPVQAAAQLISSVRAYAHVYDVRVFGRAAGILPADGAGPSPAAGAVGGAMTGPGWGGASLGVSHGSGSAAVTALRASRSRPATASPSHSPRLGVSSGGSSPAAGGTPLRASWASPSRASPRLSRRQQAHQGPAGGLALMPLRAKERAVSMEPKTWPSTALALRSGDAAATGGSSRRATAPALPGHPPTAPSITQGNGECGSSAQARTRHASAGGVQGGSSSSSGVGLQAGALGPPGPVRSLLAAALLTHEVEEAMGGLGDAVGASDVVQFVAAGYPADDLTLTDLGTPVLEMMAAELLGLELAPELFQLPDAASPPPGCVTHPARLLHLPHVSSAGLVAVMRAVGAADDRRGGGKLPRLADGSFGWRRRGVLLLQPGLVAMVESCGSGVAGAPPLYSPREVQALMAAALAPMVLPGGGGWRLEVWGASGVGVEAGNKGVGHKGALAVADAVTAVALADVAPAALMARLPHQLLARWERLYRAMSRVTLGAAAAGDRAALVVAQSLEPCVTAIYKSVVGCSSPDECPPAHELVAAARAAAAAHSLPTLLDMAAPLTEPLPLVDAHSLALARIADLEAWARSAECGALLGGVGAGPLRRVVHASSRS